MKRVKSITILMLGMVGLMIMATDSVLQAVIGLTMLVVSIWWGSRNYRLVYREMIRMSRWIDKNILRYDKEELKYKGNDEL
jgi:membrane protein required for beta-lactamase induction